MEDSGQELQGMEEWSKRWRWNESGALVLEETEGVWGRRGEAGKEKVQIVVGRLAVLGEGTRVSGVNLTHPPFNRVISGPISCPVVSEGGDKGVRCQQDTPALHDPSL